jgi:hypothetical protein
LYIEMTGYLSATRSPAGHPGRTEAGNANLAAENRVKLTIARLLRVRIRLDDPGRS